MNELLASQDPLGDGVSRLEYIQHCGTDKMVVNAARVSHARDIALDTDFTDKDKKLLSYLLSHEHHSPLEHTLITFKVKAPLFVSTQMLKHRIGVSINSQSLRYIDPTKVELECLRKYYLPPKFRLQATTNRQGSYGELPLYVQVQLRNEWQEQCDALFTKYEEFVAAGMCREEARGILPTCTYTSCYFTCNLRSLYHFLSLRAANDAQYEIRVFARGMYTMAKYLFPKTFEVIDELNLLPKETEIPNDV